MKKDKMYSVIEIAQRMNEIGKTKTLKEIGISDRTWRNRLNATDVKYNRQTKKYDIPEIDVMDELEERGIINKEFNDENLNNEFIEDIVEDVVEDITEDVNNETTEEEPNKAIDILSFIKKNKSNNETVSNEVEVEEIETKTDEVINNQSEEEDEIEKNEVFDDEVIENKPKNNEIKKNTSEKERINKKVELEEGYTLHRLSINKELLKRLKFLAVSENMNMDKVIEDLLSEALKNRYYEEIKSRAN